ncbi:MAG: MGMT family protein [Ignavibacteriae bacterium]|nr:MGMT family protein [Ignavibacteria bacterium]MBI3365886.1 MGMT family protein [Ignavibacteriota bacterium]
MPYRKPPSNYEIIWETVSRIPKGKVATYGQIAELCGLPRQARLVGYALHNLPRGSDVPWQRVINAQGGISLSDLDGMYEEQIRLLKKEGIKFIRGKVNLYRYGWRYGWMKKSSAMLIK